jgi:hypothetical protein
LYQEDKVGAAWYLPEERLIVRPDQMLDEMYYGKSCQLSTEFQPEH